MSERSSQALDPSPAYLTTPAHGTTSSPGGAASGRRPLHRAADFQRALLPPPLYSGALVEAAAMTRPCWAVGGDFYDYFDSELEFRVVLGDACGKGTAAALQAAVVQGILAVEAEDRGGPARVMAHLNRALCRRLIPARFVTLFYGVVTPGRRLTYCNAGHCQPLLVDGHRVRHLDAGGPPLGLLGEACFEEAMVELNEGDVLAACSDGVLEAVGETPRGPEEFGETRILDVVRSNSGRGPRDIVKELMAAVREFTAQARPRDDMTAVVVRCRPWADAAS